MFAVILVVLEHGSDKHRQSTLEHLVSGLLEYSTNEQGYKSVAKALKEGGKETLDMVVKRMCEPAKGFVILIKTNKECFLITYRFIRARRATVVDLALSVTGSQLIASVLPMVSLRSSASISLC